MSAAERCEFKMESRPYGDGRTNFAGITCGWCKTELWLPAKDAGWAIRIFRANKWKVGNRPNQHRCPGCFGKARLGRKPVDNPAIPPEVGAALKKRIVAAHVEEFKLSIAEPATQEAQEAPPVAEAPTTPAIAPIPSAPALSPPTRTARRRRKIGQEPVTYSRRDNARRGAQTTLGRSAKDGVDFFVVRVAANSWTWKTPAEATDRERAAWARRNKETPMANEPTSNVTPLRKEPMPTPDPKKPVSVADSVARSVSAAARQPTREERGLIHDELTRIYDTVGERYVGGDSDKVVAERLDVPRAWVTEVRNMFFGDHDRNQSNQLQIAKLDAAIVMAKDATAKLLQMAQDAEALEKDLTAARKLLGD